MTEFHDPVVDRMKRTKVNLHLLKQLRADRLHAGIRVDDDGVGPYDVTQLVNSLLGVLVHPWENLLQTRQSAVRRHFSTLPFPNMNPEFPNTDDLPDNNAEKLKWLRHALAHGGVKFIVDEYEVPPREIKRIAFRNNGFCRKRDRNVTWGTVLTIPEVETLLECMIELAEKIDEKTVHHLYQYAAD